MSAELLYLSDEWCAAVKEKLSTTLTAEEMKHTSTSMVNVYENCPDGKKHYFYTKMEGGLFTQVLVGTDGNWPKAEFDITANYEMFAKVSRGELRSQKALMSGKMKLKGNMIKALKLVTISDKMNKLISQVPTAFEGGL
ncbi:MAG: SCP2 sterol-binding domain-containing protein [Spirochaetales bacterium]|nr:SCP2 sterol-binding domain-containing protein [Spirochaetales bacterium]